MRLPSRAECLTLLDRYRTPRHVVRHSFVVNRVAVFLAEKLRKRGVDVDVDVVDRASLLHDMLRVVNFEGFDPEQFSQTISKEDLETWRKQKETYGKFHHATAARKELASLGYAALGRVVEAHRATMIQKKAKLDSWEKKCLFYADKRVVGAAIVSIDDRYHEWMERHAWGAKKLKEIERDKDKVRALEKEIFSKGKIRPEDIFEVRV